MSESTARTNILKKIKKALEQPTPLPFPKAEAAENFVQPLQQDLVVEFAEEFTKLQGKFIFCADENELIDNYHKLCYQNQWTKIYCKEDKWCNLLQQNQWHHNISSAEAAVTGCEVLVARTGSIVLSSTANNRVPSVYTPIHLCMAYTSQLVYDIKDALALVKNKYQNSFPSLISFATGPSRTADIEKTLVVGVHGPKEVYCFLVDDSPLPPGGGT
jgi:L-lactate dehydrogenase complex protein LldG